MNRLFSLFSKKQDPVNNNKNTINDIDQISLKLSNETSDTSKLRETIIEPTTFSLKPLLTKTDDSPTKKKSKFSVFKIFKQRKSIQLNLNQLSKPDEVYKKQEDVVIKLPISIDDGTPLIHTIDKTKLYDTKPASFDKGDKQSGIIPEKIVSSNSVDSSGNLYIASRRASKDAVRNTKKDVFTTLKKDDSQPSILSINNSPDESIKTITSKLPTQLTYKTFHDETQYLNLIREIIQTGSYEKSRNGNTYTKFGYNMRFNLKNGIIPLLTTKKMAWKTCFEELFWFIRGSTSNVELQKRNVHIWDDNCTREFLDKRGLFYYAEGDLGPIYGHQWRHFNAEYKSSNTCYQGEGIDQLQYIIDQLKNPATRTSRRLIITAWNPCQISSMALPPCHILAQFHVRENKYLSCALFQRSGDVGLGVPFNIASYSLLTHILAKHCDLEADEFIHFLGNCHIYEEHLDALKKQITIEPLLFPRIEIKNKNNNIEDYCLDDIIWTTKYHSHESIKMAMIP